MFNIFNMKTSLSSVFAILLLQTIVDNVLAYEIEVINRCNFQIYAKSDVGSATLRSGYRFTVHDASRVWAHRNCDGGNNNCDTFEGIVSLAEMHWDGSGKTWYDISHVDGYNLPITLAPYNSNLGGRCETVSCNYNLNSCPHNSKVYKNSQLVACKNNYRDAETDYSNSIKSACPNVYSWSKDDRAGMRDCFPGNRGLRVTFC